MSEKIETLKAERAELLDANARATSWGAALGARQERINEIEREILRDERAARTPAPDDEALVEGVARTLCHQRHPCWSIVAEIMECNVDGQADEFREHARAILAALREAGALK